MKSLAGLLLLSLCAAAQPATVCVVDTLYTSGSTPVQLGTIVYSNTQYMYGPYLIPPNSVTYQVNNGVVNICLVPGTYTVQIGTNGAATAKSYWNIPTSGGPYTIQNVTAGVPSFSSGAVVNPGQIFATGYTTGWVLTVNGGVAQWAPSVGGSGNVLNNASNTYSGGGLQDFSAVKLKLPLSTVGALPTASANTNELYLVTDGLSGTDCGIGGGAYQVQCVSNGTNWLQVGTGGIAGLTVNYVPRAVNATSIGNSACYFNGAAQDSIYCPNGFSSGGTSSGTDDLKGITSGNYYSLQANASTVPILEIQPAAAPTSVPAVKVVNTNTPGTVTYPDGTSATAAQLQETWFSLLGSGSKVISVNPSSVTNGNCAMFSALDGTLVSTAGACPSGVGGSTANVYAITCSAYSSPNYTCSSGLSWSGTNTPPSGSLAVVNLGGFTCPANSGFFALTVDSVGAALVTDVTGSGANALFCASGTSLLMRMTVTGTTPSLHLLYQVLACVGWCSSQVTFNQFNDSSLAAIHLGSAGAGGSAPAKAAGAGAGTGPTITIGGVGTDTDGLLTVLTGTSPSASATVVSFTFNTAFTIVAPHCFLQPKNTAALALAGNAAVYPTESLTGWTLSVGSTALAASTTYSWNYFCVR